MEDQDNKSTVDLRNNLRAPLIIQKIKVDGERPVFFGYSKNISRSGMFISTTNSIEPGAEIELIIPLPPPLKETIQCRCEVVWKKKPGKRLPFDPGIGIRFLNLSDEMAEKLETWIANHPVE